MNWKYPYQLHERNRAERDSGGRPLRSTPAALSKRDVIKMIEERRFHHASDLSQYGLARAVRGHSVHLFESQLVLGQRIIVDHLFGIAWQHSGSPERITWHSALKYAQEMSLARFAGSSHWRLPSIEELASLIEFDKQEQCLYIDVQFGPEQRSCWSADCDPQVGAAWGVHFDNGTVARGYPHHQGYARLVCSDIGSKN